MTSHAVTSIMPFWLLICPKPELLADSTVDIHNVLHGIVMTVYIHDLQNGLCVQVRCLASR